MFRGENLRGVALPPTHSEQAQLSRAGKLLSCVWAPLPPYLPRDDGDDDDDDGEHGSGHKLIGVKIDVVYENASYTALLVSDGQAPTAGGFTRLPLLLSRLPGPLRQQLLDYLAVNFDTLPLPLELPQTLLRQGLDGFVAESRGGGGKDVVLTFAGKGEGLRRITITVDADDVRQFWRHGVGKGGGGFLKALGEHLESVMGLRIGEVELVKVATGGFVLAVEGKAKFFEGRGSSMAAMVLEQAGKGMGTT